MGDAEKAIAVAPEISVGTQIGSLEVRVTRVDLIRYAGAALDFNPIHWNERVAVSVGLPNVIAHGMLTMAYGGRLVTEWAGDPAAVIEYGARFTRPVVVPDDDQGATIEFTGAVTEVHDQPEGRIAKILITARCDGQTVLGKAVATVRLH